MLFTGEPDRSAFHHFPHVFGAGIVGGAEMDGWMDGGGEGGRGQLWEEEEEEWTTDLRGTGVVQP